MTKSALAVLFSVIVFIIVVVLLFVTGCGNGPSVLDGPDAHGSNLSVAVTIGNHTYLPINRKDWKPSDHAKEILTILNDFEKRHPEREIVFWTIEEQQANGDKSNYIYGIWIDHRLRSSLYEVLPSQ